MEELIMSGVKEGFKKFDGDKLEWEMMPEEALEEIMKVLQYGKRKYAAWNWLDHADEVKWTRYTNALERHLKKFKRGQDIDEESGLYELAHMGCNILMLLQYQIMNKGSDNRRKTKLEIEEYYKRLSIEKFKDE